MSELNRRDFLQRAMILGAATAVGGVFVTGCNKDEGGEEGGGEEGGLDCSDTSGLSEAELNMRTSLNYVDHSTTDGQNCETCALYVAGTGCGTCQLNLGPVNPAGYCSSYSAAS